ncbi:MAG: roadblock/LC7 domain-containing protein [Acidimicrobiales bacterium]
MSAPETRDLDWLVNNFVGGIPGVADALVVTTDGLVLAHSNHIARDSADQLAAVTAGLASLTAGAARFLDGRSVRQVIVEMESGYLFVTTIGDGSSLAVMCGSQCDIGLIGYEMSLLVTRIGQVLTPAMRADRQALPRLPPR